MSEHAGHAAVIGSGVIGTACAYYLSRAGWRVTMLDRGGFGQACSHANCGLVVPSHILPLAMPGAVGSTLKTLFRKNSPLVIRPGLNWDLYRWLLKFAGRCKHRPMREAGHAIAALLDASASLYRDMIEEESLDCEWERQGCLFVFQSQQAMDHYAETDKLLSEEFGMGAERLNGEKLLEREPALNPGLAGAWFYERDSHLRPDRLLSAWRKVLEARGVTIREGCEVKSFRSKNGRVNALETSTGEVAADAFVVATGAWTPMLNRELKCKIPIQPGKGYSLTMPRPKLCPKIPLLLEEHRVAVTPMQSGYRLGSMMEFVGYDSSINPRRLNILKDGAAVYLREPFCEPVQETWYGWRPMTYDGKPIIDRSPAYENVMIAAGHNMLGLSMAPATGQLVADLLTGQSPRLDAAPYSVKRF
jgi:D-amino-acid dehydrogenase